MKNLQKHISDKLEKGIKADHDRFMDKFAVSGNGSENIPINKNINILHEGDNYYQDLDRYVIEGVEISRSFFRILNDCASNNETIRLSKDESGAIIFNKIS